jgi:hypothetical protein
MAGPGASGSGANAISLATSNGSGSASSAAEASGGGGDPRRAIFQAVAGTRSQMLRRSREARAVHHPRHSQVGGSGGNDEFFGPGGDGGEATAVAIATAAGGGMAMAKAVATGGVGGTGNVPGATGSANATSTAETVEGALAQAQSTALGSSGQATSTANTSYSFVKAQSTASAPTSGGTATSNAIAQGGSGQAFVNPGQTAYAFSTALPDKAYATTLIGRASHVASALLGPRDQVFGTAILGANYAPMVAARARLIAQARSSISAMAAICSWA